MRIAAMGCALLLALGTGAADAAVVGKTILATGAKDAVYDAKRNIIYVSAGGNIARYSLTSNKPLSPVVLGGTLLGIDIIPGGNTLAVATAEHTTGHFVVHLVNLDTLHDNKQVVATTLPSETYSYSVAYFDTGNRLGVTMHSDAGGLVPTHMYAQGVWYTEWDQPTTQLASDMILNMSGDISCATYGEPKQNKWGTFLHGTNYLDYQTSVTGIPNTGFTAANSNCAQAVASGVVFQRQLNSLFAQTGVLPSGSAQGYPLDGVYDPVRALAYFPYAGTSLVRMINMNTLLDGHDYDFGEVLNPSTYGLTVGHSRISRDGSLLMVVVNDGVHFARLYAPLTATDATTSTPAGQAVAIPVTATIGVKGTIAYSLPSAPANGTATIAGNVVTYTPNAGFHGTEVFNYTAKYGRATVTGKVSVTVN